MSQTGYRAFFQRNSLILLCIYRSHQNRIGILWNFFHMPIELLSYNFVTYYSVIIFFIKFANRSKY